MKKFFLMLSLMFCSMALATESMQVAVHTTSPITVPQHISFEECSKFFAIDQEKLFYLTLSSLSANRFSIDEVQSSTGYIIFTANRHKYLATVAGIDNANSVLKITPGNNVYHFPPGILINTFKYIDMNVGIEIK